MQQIKPKSKYKIYLSLNSVTVGVLIAGIVIAAAAFVGVFYQAKEYARVYEGANTNVIINK